MLEFKAEPKNWPHLLSVAVGAINNSPREVLGHRTPLEVAIGATKRTLIDVMLEPRQGKVLIHKATSPEKLAKHGAALAEVLEQKQKDAVSMHDVLADKRGVTPVFGLGLLSCQ